MANALRTQLSWTHCRTLIRVKNPDTQECYIAEATENNWSGRQLERGSLPKRCGKKSGNGTAVPDACSPVRRRVCAGSRGPSAMPQPAAPKLTSSNSRSIVTT
ncbi:MAG: DUF1016 N-terminal domain-containing protein [Bacteroidia bacterium]|nr:DUF1016 N-terminal domain-containing protein [Bacteroidia bacterium]